MDEVIEIALRLACKYEDLDFLEAALAVWRRSERCERMSGHCRGNGNSASDGIVMTRH